MTKVSIIVPVYNVEKYIGKCLDSLVNQTIDDYEVIVVNDGTPDNSQEIIDKYAVKYPNIVKPVIKKNGGLSDARNYGLKYAKGDYIGFVDSDDYVEHSMFEKLYNKAKENDFDITVCDINYVYDEKTVRVSSLISRDIFTKEGVREAMINIYPAAWNKLYKRKLFNNNVRFKKGVWYEDVEFLYRLFPYIDSIGTVKEALINYVQRDNSIIRSFDERLYNYIDNWNGIVEFYKQNGFFNQYQKQIEYCYIRYVYCTFIISATNFDKKEFFKAVKIAKKNVNEKFSNYRKNKYFYKNLKGIYMLAFSNFSAKLVYIFRKIIKK